MLGVSAGCNLVHPPRDVTRSPERWGGYRPGEVYELIVDAQLDRDDVPVVDSGDPSTMFVLATGTRLRIDRFVARTAPWNRGVYVFATVQDGPYKGKRLDVYDLSIPSDDPETESPVARSPDPSKIRLVENPP